MNSSKKSGDFVFVHIPKTAGTAVFELLGIQKHQQPGHRKVKDIPALELSGKTSFAVCRHPVERFVSMYRYAAQKSSYWHSDDKSTVYPTHPDRALVLTRTADEIVEHLYNLFTAKPNTMAGEDPTLEVRGGCLWVGKLKSRLKGFGWDHQFPYVVRQGAFAVHHVVRLENLREGLEKIGIDTTNLKVINKSTFTSKIVLSSESLERLKKIYDQDFRCFGYEK